MGRIRRRRVFHEEITAAAGSALVDDNDAMLGDTPRYGAGANIENHPQVTDLVPRRFRVIGLLVVFGIGIGAFGEISARSAASWSERVGIASSELTQTLATRPIAWASAVLLLVTACASRLIFTLRRHRVDDDRGRYRVWRTAAWFAVAVGFLSVTKLHTVAGVVLGHLTGWGLLPEGRDWWLVPAAIGGAWLMGKLMLDASESRAALAILGLASLCFVVAALSLASIFPVWDFAGPATVQRLLPLAGYVLLSVGTLWFARYVVLDVQGLIVHKPSASKPSAEDASRVSNVSATVSPISELKADLPVSTENDGWVDGSEEPKKRRLSKAERKQLKKLQKRNRAA